jgi:hypothetical protein
MSFIPGSLLQSGPRGSARHVERILGRTEIEDLDAPTALHHYLLGFETAMSDLYVPPASTCSLSSG